MFNNRCLSDQLNWFGGWGAHNNQLLYGYVWFRAVMPDVYARASCSIMVVWMEEWPWEVRGSHLRPVGPCRPYMVPKWCYWGPTEPRMISGSYPIDGTGFLLLAIPDRQVCQSYRTCVLLGEETTHHCRHNRGRACFSGSDYINVVLAARLVVPLCKLTHWVKCQVFWMSWCISAKV